MWCVASGVEIWVIGNRWFWNEWASELIWQAIRWQAPDACDG